MKNVILFCIFFSLIKSYSQQIEKHQWKNRVLLVFSNTKDDEKFQRQIEILSKEKKGLSERKLKIYQFSENQFTTDFNTAWFSSTLTIKKYIRNSEGFKVVLVGLDGGIKVEQTSLLSTEKLFAIIDGMLMRREEIRNKN